MKAQSGMPFTLPVLQHLTDSNTYRLVQNAARPALSDIEFEKHISKRLSEREKKYLSGCTHSKLEELMQVCLDEAQAQQEKHDLIIHWRKRLYRGTEELMNNVHGYVEAYSGFAQLMNGAGQGYGDAAHGALSLLLLVCARILSI